MNGIDVNGVLVLVIRCSFVSLFKQDSIGVEKEKNDLKANVSEREEEERREVAAIRAMRGPLL